MLQPYSLNLQSCETKDLTGLFARDFSIPILENYPSVICTQGVDLHVTTDLFSWELPRPAPISLQIYSFGLSWLSPFPVNCSEVFYK